VTCSFLRKTLLNGVNLLGEIVFEGVNYVEWLKISSCGRC
jgi:hypothetical protein